MRKQLNELKSWRKTLTAVTLSLTSLVALILMAVFIIDPLMPGSFGYAALVAMAVLVGMAVLGIPIYVGLYFLYPAKWVRYWTSTLSILGLAFLAYIFLYSTLN